MGIIIHRTQKQSVCDRPYLDVQATSGNVGRDDDLDGAAFELPMTTSTNSEQYAQLPSAGASRHKQNQAAASNSTGTTTQPSPRRTCRMTSSRDCCVRSPWMARHLGAVREPPRKRFRLPASSSQPARLPTNTSTLPSSRNDDTLACSQPHFALSSGNKTTYYRTHTIHGTVIGISKICQEHRTAPMAPTSPRASVQIEQYGRKPVPIPPHRHGERLITVTPSE